MSSTFEDLAELTGEKWAAREQILRRFDNAWRHGPRPALEDYMPADERQRRTVLLELVHTELEYRLKDGEPARVEEYLVRFPELKNDPEAELELVAAELELRRRREPSLARDEFVARFPQYQSELLSTRRGPCDPDTPLPHRPTCPQCYEPLEVPGDEPPETIRCSACGATVRIDRGRGTPWWPKPSRLGKYEVLGELGRGAFGVVFHARDSEIDRDVALKVPRAGHLATPEEQDRFLREAPGAAQLDHPHIVAIHDAGRVEETCYLACAFVAGTTLARRLAVGHLPFREAAALAARLADALHYAHTQGVVHRDVKPANILLDMQGDPHLTDFGLAKREAGEITLTLDGELLGTPAYMAPEQARGEAHRVDGRSDLYSHGVVLYQMLTGELPFRGNPMMVQKQVLEEEPQPPRRLNDRIPRDLETICLKCLQKEPSRRYDSAGVLAEDLRRFLNGEPIRARPVGRVERLGRWCRRNPRVAGLSAAFVVAVLGGFASVSWQWLQTSRQRDRAVEAESQANTNLIKVREEEAKLIKSVSETRSVLNFFQKKVMIAAQSKDAEGGLGIDATIRAAMDAAEPEIEKSFAGQPAVEASIRDTLGATYVNLGEPALAIRQLERAVALLRQILEPGDSNTLTSMETLGMAYLNAGRLDDASLLFEETLKLYQAKLGTDHEKTLTSMNHIALAYQAAGRFDEALPLFEESSKRWQARFGPDHRMTLLGLSTLASAYISAGRLRDALVTYEAVVKRQEASLGPDHPNTLLSIQNLTLVYRALDRREDARRLLVEVLKRQQARLGPDHPITLMSKANLAVLYADSGQFGDAVPMLEDVLKRRQGKQGPDHPDTLITMSNLAAFYFNAGRIDDALHLSEEALKRCEAKMGPDHPHTLSTMSNLTNIYRETGRHNDALLLSEETLKRTQAKMGPDHPQTLITMENLSNVYLDDKRFDDAVRLLEEVLKRRRVILGPNHADTLRSVNDLAQTYLNLKGRFAEAEPILREALAIPDKKTPDDWRIFETRWLLGACLLGQKKYAEAEPLLVQGYEGLKAREAKLRGYDKKNLPKAGERIIQLYEAWDKKDKAEAWRQALRSPPAGARTKP